MHFSTTGHPDPEAIVAYIDGTMSPEVAGHIQGCETCYSDAANLDTAQTRLRRALHRFDCPEPHRLGEYELGYLLPAQRVEVASHALECTLCTEELQALRAFMAVEPPVTESLASHLRRIFATLLAPTPGLGLAGIRGADTQLRQYQADNARISIGPGAERGSLIGLLVRDEPDKLQGEARMLPETGSPHTAPVDELGNFEFEDLTPGAYTLEIQLADEVIVVESLEVE